MNHTDIFLLPDGRLRAGWRLLLFVIAFMLAGAGLGWVPRPPSEEYFFWRLLSPLLHVLAAVGLTAALMRLLERRRFRDVGLRFDAGWASGLAWGGLAGAAMIALTTIGVVVLGGAGLNPAADTASAARQAFLLWTVILMLGASLEELLFRGYPFQVLVEGLGPWAATIAASGVFGALHWMNPNATALSTANTALAGVMLSLAYLQSRALWYPIALHFAWNWSMAALGFPLSGLALPHLGWVAAGPPQTAWLHGGDYGPEGGVVCTVVLGAMCLALWLRPAWVGCRQQAGPPMDLPPAPPVPQTIFTATDDSPAP